MDTIVEIQLFFFTYTFLGMLGVGLNCYILFAIIKSKKFVQNRWLILAGSLFASDFVLSLGYAISSIVSIDQYVRVHLVGNKTSPIAKYSNLACTGVNFLLIIGSLADQFLIVSITVDRVLSCNWPVIYFKHNQKIMKCLVWSSYVTALIISFASFINESSMVLCLKCVTTESLSPTFKQVYYCLMNTTSCLSVIGYIWILIAIKKQKNRLKSYCDNSSFTLAKQLQRQLKVTTTVSITILCHCLTSVPAYFLYNVISAAKNINPGIAVHLLLVCELFIVVSTILNSFVYALRIDEIRNSVASKRCKNFLCFLNRVNPESE